MNNELSKEQVLDAVALLCRRAGEAIMAIYQTPFDVEHKEDDSPLTRADLAAHEILKKGLSEEPLNLPVLSEEGARTDFSVRSGWSRYWLVDPLDGTKEFVKKNDEFTVNVALIDGHKPVLGVVHAPALGLTYTAATSLGAFKQIEDGEKSAISVAERARQPVRVAGSRSHRGKSLERFLEKVGDYELLAKGSSLKLCLVAEGAADIYPRLGPTSEWDIAAGQSVLECAGGSLSQLDGKPLLYNAEENLLNPFFLAAGPTDRDWLAMLAD